MPLIAHQPVCQCLARVTFQSFRKDSLESIEIRVVYKNRTFLVATLTPLQRKMVHERHERHESLT